MIERVESHIVFQRTFSEKKIGGEDLAVIQLDLSRNKVEPAAAENYPASRN